MQTDKTVENNNPLAQQEPSAHEASASQTVQEEIGGVNGLEPTRYGDWEKNGRCVDF